MLQGWRYPKNRLWRVPLQYGNANNIIPATGPVEIQEVQSIVLELSMNIIYECENTTQLIKYFHATFFSPVKSTWIKAIHCGYFRGCTCITAAAVNKFSNVEEATTKGHMDQTRQGQQSTKNMAPLAYLI